MRSPSLCHTNGFQHIMQKKSKEVAMDSIIITAAVILAVICIIEIVLFFLSSPAAGTPAYVSVLPVFENDTELSERLEYLAIKSCGRRKVVIVDYSATPEQEEMCRGFVKNSPDAVFIPASELEKTLKEMFSA